MFRRRSRFGLLAYGIRFAGLVLLCLFFALVAIYAVKPPVSTLMLARTIEGKSYKRTYVRLDGIAPALIASVIASEDSTFCRNDGVDWDALRGVLDRADSGGPRRGASTITMQTAKNLFLWPGRSAVRKGIEIGMALVLGKSWSKRRVMEVYLNVAEWGDGIFGAEAASQHYFHKRASQLSPWEAALLATSLPNPIRRDAARPNLFHQRLAGEIQARVSHGLRLDCVTQSLTQNSAG